MMIGPDRLISEDLPTVIIIIIITRPIIIAELRPYGMFLSSFFLPLLRMGDAFVHKRGSGSGLIGY